MLASLLDISSACTLSTEIDHESQSVQMLKTLEFQRRICSLDIELENGSDEDKEIVISTRLLDTTLMNGFKLSELNSVASNVKWFLNRNNASLFSEVAS
jgi:hypothetical protein